MSEDNALVGKLLEARIRGRNYFQIEQDYGIPALEARQLVNEALAENATRDSVEMRQLVQLRLEAITDKLWEGLENGSFKHGEAILRAAQQMAELMDLNQQTIKQQISIITDEETQQIFHVLKLYGGLLLGKVSKLPLNQKAKAQLEEWPAWSADAATEAIEQAVYAEEED